MSSRPLVNPARRVAAAYATARVDRGGDGEMHQLEPKSPRDAAHHQTNTLPIGQLHALVAEANEEGLLFLNRLVDDWRSGANWFDQIGEALFLAYRQHKLLGVCGLNVDPYAQDRTVGRVRHLFVRRAARRTSIGRLLLETVVAEAKGRFRQLRLKTNSADADAFYRRMGFHRIRNSEHATHCVSL
jgi:GNAT superfamily N-acetyltransferase